MDPSVLYAPTADDVRIALYTLGYGPALVVLPTGPWSSISIEARIPAWGAWYARLAQSHMVVRYDLRGTGLSDRAPVDFSLEAQIRDLEAVHDRLGLTTYALLAMQHAGPIAIAYAARHPQRVPYLLLWCTYARGADYFEAPQSQTLHHFMDQDWTLFTETMAHARLGWAQGDLAHALALLARDSLTPQLLATFDSVTRTIDVSAELPRVQARTLVLHRQQVRYPDTAVAVRLAADIRDARLLLLDGDSIAPFVGDGEKPIAAIEAFLSEGAPAALASGSSGSSGSSGTSDRARSSQQLVDPLSARARGATLPGRGPVERGDCARTLRLCWDGQDPYQQHLPQARCEQPYACGCTGSRAGPAGRRTPGRARISTRPSHPCRCG